MRLVTLWCLSLGLVAASAQAQSITSFEPDTASQSARERTPPDMVDIPVWFGWQLSPGALAASTLERSKLALGGRDASNLPWVGVSAAWPWASNHQGWFDAGYEHWQFESQFDAVPFAGGGTGFTYEGRNVGLDEFAVRAGVDQLVGRADHPWAAFGVGLGSGMGWLRQSAYGADAVFSAEFITHAHVYVQPSRTTRFALGAAGAIAFESSRGLQRFSPWSHVELSLRVERALRVPKRIVPGL
jgi:hypothetical protein